MNEIEEKYLLTNLEELSFRIVLAFPYDSKIGFVCTILSSKLAFFSPEADLEAFSFEPKIAK